MAKKTTPNSTSIANSLSNNRSWHDYLSESAFQYYPEKDNWRKRLIYSLYEWIENKDNIEVMQFCMEYKIPYTTLKEWINKYPDVKNAYNDIKLMLASRRRIGVVRKDFDREAVFKDLHTLDPEWLAINRYHAELKNIEAATAQMQIVEIPSARDTGKVKPRIKATENAEQDKE